MACFQDELVAFFPLQAKEGAPPFSTQPAKAMGRHSHEFTTKSWLLPCTVRNHARKHPPKSRKKHSSSPTCPPWFYHGFPIFLFGWFWWPAIDPRCQVGLDHPICYLFPRRSGQTPRQWRSLGVISIGWGVDRCSTPSSPNRLESSVAFMSCPATNIIFKLPLNGHLPMAYAWPQLCSAKIYIYILLFFSIKINSHWWSKSQVGSRQILIRM